MIRSIAGRLGLMILGIVIAVLFFEVGIRLTYLRLPYSVQIGASGVRLGGLNGPPLGLLINSLNFYETCEGDERLFARMLPDLEGVPIRFGPDNVWKVTTNSIGFEDIGFRTLQNNGDWDGVVVGDSFAFCMGVEMEDCWVQQLAEATGTGIANLGMPGTGSESHLRYLEDYGWALNPKVVIWQFFPNDVNDDYNHIIKGRQGCPRVRTDANPGGGVRNLLSRSSVTYTLILRPAMRRLLPQIGQPQPPAEFAQITTTNNKRLLTPTFLVENNETRLQKGLSLTKEAILLAAQQTSEKGSSFLLILAPRNLQVYSDFLQTEQKAAIVITDKLMDELVAFAQRHQIHYVDLRPALREAAARGDILHLTYDTHWSPEGNRLVANLLTDVVLHELEATNLR